MNKAKKKSKANKPIVQEKYLPCNCCNRELPLDSFYKYSTTTRGYTYSCKECSRKKDRESRLEKNKSSKRKKAYADLPWPIIPKYKACKTCEKTMPSSLFNKQKTSNDGLQPSCKNCLKERYAKKKSKK